MSTKPLQCLWLLMCCDCTEMKHIHQSSAFKHTMERLTGDANCLKKTLTASSANETISQKTGCLHVVVIVGNVTRWDSSKELKLVVRINESDSQPEHRSCSIVCWYCMKTKLTLSSYYIHHIYESTRFHFLVTSSIRLYFKRKTSVKMFCLFLPLASKINGCAVYSGEEIQTQNLNIYSINEVII